MCRPGLEETEWEKELREQIRIIEPYLCPEDLEIVRGRMERFLRTGGNGVFGYGADLRHTLKPEEILKLIRIQVITLFTIRPELLDFSSFILCVFIEGHACTPKEKEILAEQMTDCLSGTDRKQPEITIVTAHGDEKIQKTGFHMMALP